MDAVHRAGRGLPCPDPTRPPPRPTAQIPPPLLLSATSRGELGGRELAADSFVRSFIHSFIQGAYRAPSHWCRGTAGVSVLVRNSDNNQKRLCDYGFERCWAGHGQCVSSGSDTSRAVTTGFLLGKRLSGAGGGSSPKAGRPFQAGEQRGPSEPGTLSARAQPLRRAAARSALAPGRLSPGRSLGHSCCSSRTASRAVTQGSVRVSVFP